MIVLWLRILKTLAQMDCSLSASSDYLILVGEMLKVEKA